MCIRDSEYTIHLENEVMQKTYPIEGDDMTLEIQALINHNQSTHTLSLIHIFLTHYTK